MKGAKVLEARAVVFELEIEIDAPRDRVWKALVDDTNAWWLPDFHMVGEGSVVTLAPEAGGHLVERRPDGGSLVWGTVQWCAPGEVMYLNGSVSHDWGGPAGTVLKLALEDRSGSTVLKVTHEMYGHVSDENIESLSQGWRQLFGKGLKRFVEDGVQGNAPETF